MAGIIGEKVIAKRDCPLSNFKRGDTLEICGIGTYVDYHAYNLTRPELNERYGVVFVHDHYVRKINPEKFKPKPTHKIYFLGIPIGTLRKVDENADS